MEIEELNKLPRTKQEAKDLNSKFYFTNRQCKRKHLAERYTSGGHCVECHKINSEKFDTNNPDYYNDRYSEIKHKPEFKEKSARLIIEKRERMKTDPEFRKRQAQRISNWAKQNPDKRLTNKAKRRAQKVKATPLFVAKKYKQVESPEQKAKFKDIRKLINDQIQAIYAEARRLTEETGIRHHVDHIWPINPKEGQPQGLHVPANLQILKHSENESKGNKLPNDMKGWHLHELNENRICIDPNQRVIQD